MTDAEIKKDLLFVAHYCHDEYNEIRVDVLLLNALDLINRQQAEIESVNNRADMWHREAELNAAELIKMQTEIERLQAYKTLYEDLNAEYLETIACIKSIKAEAIKEFAERLKTELYIGCYEYEYLHAYINNLVKEMVGESNV